MNIKNYFEKIEKEVKRSYEIAGEARKKGLDPASEVEIPVATSLAERVIGLASVLYPQIYDKRIAARIAELEKEYGSLDPAVSLKIAEEVAKEKFCKFESHIQAVEAGVRIALGYMTLGYVSSPIEGFVELKVKKTSNGKDFFAPYYSGPIRSAGGTEEAFSLVIVDYLRETFGYEKYDPTEDEVKRGVQECYEYHERITNLQYLPSEEEIDFLMRNLPIQVTGDPSEDKEVFNYKDLPRVETNFIRSGFALVIAEGMAQKAPKIFGRVTRLKQKGFALSGWNWLEDFVKLQKKIKEGKSKGSRGGATYIQDLVAGRPVFSHPSESGALRLRYGRTRNTGYSTLALHPATMEITQGFIAIGTQLKTEKPTKGCTVASCDHINGPIVKLKNGSVKYLKDPDEAKRLYKETEEIIYLGDILVPYGDFLNRNHPLEKQGYIEQYWLEEARAKGGESGLFVDFEKACELSKKFGVSLHPDYIYYWREISYDSLLALIDWIAHGEIRENVLVLPYRAAEKERFSKGKRALEIIGCEHQVTIENVVLNLKDTKSLLFNLGINSSGNLEEDVDKVIARISDKSVLEVINDLCELEIRDKSGTFIGSRMGRPEKAKLRKLTGSPHVLFPVGGEGGRLRSFQAACDFGSVKAEFSNFYCENCKSDKVYRKCEDCGEFCKVVEKEQTFGGNARRIDIKRYFDSAKKIAGVRAEEIPIVKGVRGTSNKDHAVEHLSKGLLRAKYNLNVNKDGTIRYDMTEMPITHFKPFEVETSVEKLKAMGYEKDIYGNDLEKEDQILEIFPHDIILPSCPDTPDERADDVFLNVSKFIDEELEKLYGLPRFFNANKREDLAGVLISCMSPHTSASVVGRIIGFSKVQALLASPYIHAAMRRDCVHPDTKLFFYNSRNDKVFYDKIGKYVEELISKGAKGRKIDGAGTLAIDIDEDLYCVGIDPDTHELKKKKIKYFIKGPETKEWVKIKTATNREYIMTPTHKFMYINNGKFEFKDAKEIKVDDKLPVLESFNFEIHKDRLNVIQIFKENLSIIQQRNIFVCDEKTEIIGDLSEFKDTSNEKVYLRHKFSKHVLPAFIKIDENLMRILGYYAAEGYSRTNKWVSQAVFRICNSEMQEDIKKCIKGLLGKDPSIGEDGTKITICSKIFYYLLKCLGAGDGAYSKRVPTFIFSLNKELVKEYLSAYFEGDGSFIKKRNIVFYSVSRSLLDDVSLLLNKFGVLGRYHQTKARLPGKAVLEKYKKLSKEPKEHVLYHLVLGRHDSYKLARYLNKGHFKLDNVREFAAPSKRYLKYNGQQIPLVAQSDYVEDYVKEVELIKDTKNSYCVEIEWDEKEDRNVLWGEQIINTRCDGDESAIMLLMDLLLNFSRKFIPSHRGGTQDAPLVLNIKIKANEVDDMIFDVDTSSKIPLELFQAGERHEMPSSVKMEQVKGRLGGEREFTDLHFSYDTSNINKGPLCSSYKTLPTMQEKVDSMMELCKKIRAVDTDDASRLVIERHFIRDTRGNLRKFSMQGFRCVACNEKFRRPPLVGRCTKCGGKLLFTISEGSILKYMQPALNLARTYNASPYLLESLELTEMYIQSIFGKDLEKQETINKWF